MIARTILAALAVAAGASAFVPRNVCNADNCLRALRATSPKTRFAQAQADCAAYLTVTSTPVATATEYDTSVAVTTLVEEVITTQSILDTFTSTIRETPTTTVYTETTTITIDPIVVVTKRAEAAIPTIPAYASPCSGAIRYSSACLCIGASSATTIIAPTSTTTVTVSTTISNTAHVTSVVSTSTTTIFEDTTTVTVTAAEATVETIATETVTKSSSSAAPAEPTKGLFNGDFENIGSVTPWIQVGRSELSPSTSMARKGSQSGLITVANGSDAPLFIQHLNVDVDEAYEFGIWVRQNTLACSRVWISCGTRSSEGVITFFSGFTAMGSQFHNTWARLTTQCSWNSVRLANAIVTVRLGSDCRAGQEIFFDDASLIKL